jgi:hypothetical protein
LGSQKALPDAEIDFDAEAATPEGASQVSKPGGDAYLAKISIRA